MCVPENWEFHLSIFKAKREGKGWVHCLGSCMVDWRKEGGWFSVYFVSIFYTKEMIFQLERAEKHGHQREF